MKRGRKTFASNVIPLDVTGARPRVTPPSSLNAEERKLFKEIISNNPHLHPADSPLLVQLVQHLIMAMKLGRRMDEKSVKLCDVKTRAAISLSTKLRVTAQAQVHPGRAGRDRLNAKNPLVQSPWDEDDDD